MGSLRRSSADLLSEARSRIDRLDPAEAARRSDLVFVDTRDSADRAHEGVIPGSVWVPRSVLEWRVDPDAERPDPRISNPDLALVVVCNDGFSSSLDAARLREMGFDRASDLIGGFRAWKAAGLPVVADER
jgi:rhodanese-related sulfurtransferase